MVLTFSSLRKMKFWGEKRLVWSEDSDDLQNIRPQRKRALGKGFPSFLIFYRKTRINYMIYWIRVDLELVWKQRFNLLPFYAKSTPSRDIAFQSSPLGANNCGGVWSRVGGRKIRDDFNYSRQSSVREHSAASSSGSSILMDFCAL